MGGSIFRELGTAVAAVLEAGARLREHFGRPATVTHKRPADLVTEMDQIAETVLIDRLRADFPTYGFLTEESPAKFGSGQGRWLIDPLDGTTNYAHGYPLFAISVALERAGEIVLGVVYNPLAGEVFTGVRGCGATLNGRPICISPTASLAESLIGSGFPYNAWESDIDNSAEWRHLLKCVLSLRADGSAVLDLCHVACGRLDGYWELDLDPWDMAAGALIVQEAGGTVTDVHGMPFSPYGRSVVASNGHIHRAMLEALAL